MPRLPSVVIFAVLILSAMDSPAEEKSYSFRATFSRSVDRGENPGTLWEVRDGKGKRIAGAGYMGAYNTFPRSDRELLHVYVRSQQPEAEWQIERLPRVDGTATGYYPFQVAGELYVSTRNGSDPRVHRWDETAGSWRVVSDVRNGTERISGNNFHVSTDQVTYAGQTLLTPDESYRFGEHYFAHGKLILRAFRSPDMSPANRFLVYDWNPTENKTPQALAHLTLELPQPREFVYTFGQWQQEILAITNMGGVYRLRPQGWEILRTPIPTVSYQIYCGLNYRDSLLFGHYPTGELYEYNGDQLELRQNWPPVLSGVSRNAREAQTLAIYNGELYCGVWPWGELWRYDDTEWKIVQRLFTHPQPTDAVTHPYEAETKQVDKVYNLWGQRVTGLVPYRDSLIITTSSKGGAPWDPKFDFLSPEQRLDYGAIYRARLPGQIAIHVPPSSEPMRFEIQATGTTLKILINDREAASLPVTPEIQKTLLEGTTLHGSGVFGHSTLQISTE